MCTLLKESGHFNRECGEFLENKNSTNIFILVKIWQLLTEVNCHIFMDHLVVITVKLKIMKLSSTVLIMCQQHFQSVVI